MPDPEPLDDRMTNRRPVTRIQLLALLLGVTILASTCGQVITPEPTSTPPPAEEPMVTPTATVAYSTTPGPIGSPGDASTPTVTPTPVEHVVEKGDTLLAIALDFGVSVDALQRANGIEDAQYLQVGQRLVIPIGEEPDDSSPVLLLPTPTPQPIQVQGVAFYETPVGSLRALGEIANTTALTLTNVQVKVVLLDAGGQPLLETDTFAATDIIFPEARSPFSVLFTNPPTEWVSYQATIIRGQEAGALAAGVVPLSVVEADGNPAGPQFQIRGRLRNNTSDQVADTVEIFATTYDAQGNVTGYRRVNLDSEEGLAPGEEKVFTVTLVTHGDGPDDFSVTALGRTADRMNSGG